jgi:hypothetical protein
VFQAKAGRGKLLAAGLNLLSGQPEAEWLLDQFIRYARSPQFQPRGTFDPRNPGKAWKELWELASSPRASYDSTHEIDPALGPYFGAGAAGAAHLGGGGK